MTISPTFDSFFSPLTADVDKTQFRAWALAVEAAANTVGELQGFKAGLQYTFSTTTGMADPGNGFVRFNHATAASITAIAVDDFTFDGVDVSAWTPQWDDSTSTIKGTLIVVSNANNDPSTAVFNITGATDNAGWTQLAVTYVSGTLPSNNERIALQFYRAGDTSLGYVAVNKAGDTMTGKLTSASSVTGNSAMATATSNLGSFEIIGNGTGAAMVAFHRPSAHAAYFGLDTDNVWKVGGWSLGANAYKLWHAGNHGSGSGLDADTVDGVQAAAIAQLGAANTFTQSQTISVSAAGGAALTIMSTHATDGTLLDLNYNDPSPATGVIGQSRYLGRNSSNAEVIFGIQRVETTDITAGSEDSQYVFQTQVAGTRATRMYLANGMVVGSPTGGDKGAGAVNASAVYDDNTLLTCMAMAEEFHERGEIDLDKWDGFAPDIVVPARTEEVPIYETVTREQIVLEPSEHGLVARTKKVTETVPAVDWTPVYDVDGNGIAAVSAPASETVTHPEQILKREHRTARVFAAMLADGFDPREPEQYFRKLRGDEALPGMPNQKDWEHGALSAGEMHNRLWLATEMLAIVVHVMWGKLKDHEARISKLEN